MGQSQKTEWRKRNKKGEVQEKNSIRPSTITKKYLPFNLGFKADIELR